MRRLETVVATAQRADREHVEVGPTFLTLDRRQAEVAEALGFRV